jgi:miniconductance mechanosensitive channel
MNDMSTDAIHPLLQPLEGWIAAHPTAAVLAIAAFLVVVGEVCHRLVRRYVLRLLQYLAGRSSSRWDDALFEARLPQRLTWGVPLFIWYNGVSLIPGMHPVLVTLIQRVLLASMVVLLVRAFAAGLDGINRIYTTLPRARQRPIKGFLQVANVVAHALGLIFVIAILMDRSPVLFLSGLGAMTAVLLLVFRDTLLSLVAGMQLTLNDLLRVGDWIELPQFGADGDVVDIALNSVTVQNWDRTFTVIPTHKFLEHSFKNWRGMQASGGRRIKRALHVDQSSVRFLDDAEVDAFERWALLRDYIGRKKAELAEFNAAQPRDGVPHARRLTNLGTFRAYVVEYLKAHPQIRQDMTFLVRHLAPGPEGLPIEVYVFAGDTRWAVYEGIQADVFDHLLAIVPAFGLRVFQNPAGADIRLALSGGAGVN